MGLDMYFLERVSIDPKPYNGPESIMCVHDKAGDKIINSSKIKEIVLDVGYMRNAYDIHRWLIEHIVINEAKFEHYLHYDDIIKLRGLCSTTSINWPQKDKEIAYEILNNMCDVVSDYYYSYSW